MRGLFALASKDDVMPRPSNPLSLVRTQTDSFPFPGWDVNFAPYRWFYLGNFKEILSGVNIWTGSQIKIGSSYAIPNVPQSWTNVFQHGNWDSLSYVQIKNAMSTAPMRFDKACLCILSVEYFARMFREINDIYGVAEIRPAIFKVDNLREAMTAMTEKQRDYLCLSISQSRRLIDDMASGCPVTEHTAINVVNTLREMGFHYVYIRMITDRTDKGRQRFKSPSAFEVIF